MLILNAIVPLYIYMEESEVKQYVYDVNYDLIFVNTPITIYRIPTKIEYFLMFTFYFSTLCFFIL